MPDLNQTLRSTDLDYLQRIARGWKYELTAQSFAPAVKELITHMIDPAALEETLAGLPEDALQIWRELQAHQGRMSWALFIRQFLLNSFIQNCHDPFLF